MKLVHCRTEVEIRVTAQTPDGRSAVIQWIDIGDRCPDCGEVATADDGG